MILSSSCKTRSKQLQEPLSYNLDRKNLDGSAKLATVVQQRLLTTSAKPAGHIWAKIAPLVPQTLLKALLFGCFSSPRSICTRFHFDSWPFGNGNPIPRRHRQSINVGLAVFPRTGNQPIFPQPLPSFTNSPRRQSGIRFQRPV